MPGEYFEEVIVYLPTTKLLVLVLIISQQQRKVTHIDGLLQDCSISSTLAMEILQSYTTPSIVSWQNADLSLTVNHTPI